MKRKITIESLIEIENIIQEKQKEGCYNVDKLDNLFNSYTSRNAKETKAFALAVIMPINEISMEIKQYDESRPKIDELKFVKDLSNKYNVSKNDVILRIQYVRRINKKESGYESRKSILITAFLLSVKITHYNILIR